MTLSGLLAAGVACAQPVNDDFTNAIPLSEESTTVGGTTVGATPDLPGPPITAFYPTAWWKLVPTRNGTVTIQRNAQFSLPRLTVFSGTYLTNLTTVSGDGSSGQEMCTMVFEVRAGVTYYLAAIDTFGSGEDFNFAMAFHAAPANASIDAPKQISASATSVSGTAMGVGPNSAIWWSWISAESGPVILTTAGSTCDTYMGVSVASAVNPGVFRFLVDNDDATYWFSASDGPVRDPISRLRLNAVAGTPYKIVIGVKEPDAGDVTLNFTKVAIENILSFTRLPRPDDSLDFAANLQISNLKRVPTGRLRLRLVDRAAYYFLDGVLAECASDRPVFRTADQLIGITNLPGTGSIRGGASTMLSVSGRLAAPFVNDAREWSIAHTAMGILEEFVGGAWVVRDTRALVNGKWPNIGTFNGPGGSALTLSASTTGSAQNPSFIDIRLGPSGGVPVGGGWRVSPGDAGDAGDLGYYTQFSSNACTLLTRSTHLTLEAADVFGYDTPAPQTLDIAPGASALVEFRYVPAGTGLLTIKPFAGPNGSISPAAEQSVPVSNTISFTATPAKGFRVDQWYVNGTPAAASTNAFALMNASRSALVEVTFRSVAPILRVTVDGDGVVVPNLDGRPIQPGKRVALVARPRTPATRFSSWTGDFTTNTPVLSFVPQGDTSVQANFVANPFWEAKGMFVGLLNFDSVFSYPSNGLVNMTLTAQGNYTASLLVGRTRYSLSGAFRPDGSATSARILPSGDPVTLDMVLAADGRSISGNFQVGTQWAYFHVSRLIYNARLNPASEAGYYTLYVSGVDPTQGPGGDGIGSVRITPGGTLLFTCVLADGTRVSQGGYVTFDYLWGSFWPLYVPLYAGKGSISGSISFADYQTHDVQGDVAWIKPFQVSPVYPDGFLVNTFLLGARYSYTSGVPLLDFTSGRLWFADSVTAFTNLVTLGNNKVTNQSPNSLKFILNPATGLFNGTVANPLAGDPIAFNGVLIQKTNIGAGFYLTNQQSGRVRLEP